MKRSKVTVTAPMKLVDMIVSYLPTEHCVDRWGSCGFYLIGEDNEEICYLFDEYIDDRQRCDKCKAMFKEKDD